ncbi:NADH:flavin oxidoreductase/NADH oxidase family protein [Chromobacterium subtsugae]|uniref:NADH:flavin oxidoreductase/NADH oxidase family protein n=1 Tax=Chromobacterium subtsugae TaxID=251747 RepID=A0ABS7FKZ9_9NEIS|nr:MULTISPECIES: NADH:flavin oxidoreductase/NADH oxidase family protein [Chromobacterium]KUM03761.1 2,4-dienoyl-CoA reductase [Chromobacterium subtsugae]KZE85140.1 2,4-dienoyl-CoA reductase [Chromobacterium sp. F49]MBW7569008.1 NADH:flavin oxidoreductase/NADH oxidase family protein [Chromobacterium subtsugae]MBW8289989.1 NADH:flavin oxidoreductase/NADH oxidase family protein [Chromobacterium subtsugae]WSE92529.1 NADH:flavin oxidoreductase/NADH oxidase family protein [Chromobacterium subtsugae]
MNPFASLTLPNGSLLPNRLAKAAMEENMADRDHAPSEALIRLYRAWAEGGAGLILTGNVMVDRRAMTGPGGVVLESERFGVRFEQWSAAARARGAQIWMQINHPGRQMPAALGQPTLAPSAVAMALGNFSKQFAAPRAMSEADIADVKARFVNTARLAERFGFNGVQIHAAHGYLISQFLSPITNQRADRWGGSLENRARLLTDIVREVRAAVRPGFAVSVKLNSADFQRGGFSADDAKQVTAMLNPLGVDLIELSGGSYEAPAMHGQTRDGRTLAREAYFLEFAQDIAAVARMPVMVTGGIRRYPVVEQVLGSGVAVAGMATALAINPNLPNAWRSDATAAPRLRAIPWKNKVLASVGYMAMVKYQLRRLSQGKRARPDVAPVLALLQQQWDAKIRTGRYRRWIQRQSAAA